MQKKSKDDEDIDYRFAGAGKEFCGNCAMGHPVAALPIFGKCDLVKGTIMPFMKCDKWTPQRRKS